MLAEEAEELRRLGHGLHWITGPCTARAGLVRILLHHFDPCSQPTWRVGRNYFRECSVRPVEHPCRTSRLGRRKAARPTDNRCRASDDAPMLRSRINAV